MKKIFIFFSLLISLSASALDPTQFTVTRVTSPYFVVDGNSPSTGPGTAYVGFKVTNISGAITFPNLKFTITSIATNVVGQNYALVSPSSGIILVGTLAPGETKVCYYFVSYPANVTPQATFNYTLSDLTGTSKTGSFLIVNRSAISANAGGLAVQSINNQDLIGGVVYDDVTYTLGNTKNGDEADFQISVSTQFDPNKLTLTKTEVMTSTIPGITAGTQNSLYFVATANASSGSVTIRWTFKITNYNFTVLILPYAGATSGATNYKYSISTDLGGGTPLTISSAANPLTITKTSDKSMYGLSSPAVFTITISNPGAYPITIDKIVDNLPAGFTYLALSGTSQVTSLNSTSTPTSGNTGAITFEGSVTSAGTTSYVVPASGSIVLRYTATSAAAGAINLTTTVRGYIGTTEFANANNTVGVSATLPVTLQSFFASWQDRNAFLQWNTASENNSAFFSIEKSVDNISFSQIGVVTAAGISSNTKHYNFTDLAATASINYYRLRIVDADGRFVYSPVVSLKKSLATNNISVFPNPFTTSINIRLTLPRAQKIQLRLIDLSGKTVATQTTEASAGANDIIFHPSMKLVKGQYMLEIMANGERMASVAVVGE
jgi:hypothetical protein